MAPVFKTSNWCGTNRIKKKKRRHFRWFHGTEFLHTGWQEHDRKKKSRVQNKTKSKEITSS